MSNDLNAVRGRLKALPSEAKPETPLRRFLGSQRELLQWLTTPVGRGSLKL